MTGSTSKKKPKGILMKAILFGSLLLAAVAAFQVVPSRTTSTAKQSTVDPSVPHMTPQEQLEYESLLPTVDVSKVHVSGSCYPARDNGDGTCTRIVYSLQPGISCRSVAPSGTRTFEMNCTYKKPPAWKPRH